MKANTFLGLNAKVLPLIRIVSGMIILIIFIGLPSLSFAQEQEETTLSEIEQNAAKLMEEGHPENALEIYLYYEREIILRNWDRLQIDLLHNEAVASYQSGKLAETAAYAKQLYILEPTPWRNELKRDIETLIEHMLYHEYPDMTFQRGQASNYALWESVHRYSQAELRTTFLLSWSVVFLFIIAAYLAKKHKKAQIFLLCAVAMSLMFTITMVIFNILHYTTSNMHFGVIENNLTLHTEADYSSKTLPPNAFIPGMTVEILSTIPGWVKVMRIDGETAWIRAEDLYILRGKGDNHPAHFDESSKGNSSI
ncbi:MAG: SH3 domain-containing protein [Proteobacteria bacterium]|nr:SH3 domain-containing protein [Pseudomonadota bacterium]